MTIADGANHSLHYIAEVTYGVTPATPAFSPLPHTSCSLGMTKEAIESEKLRGDRQVEDVRHGNKQVGGEVGGELEYGAFDDLIEAALCGTWTTNVLKAGTTRRSFTIERKFGDLASPEYHRHLGCEVSSMSLSVAPNQMVGVTFGIIGQDLSTPATTIITGATYGADVGNLPFDSFTGTLNEGGSAIGVVTQLDMTLDNGIEANFGIGSALTNRPSIKKSRVTGSMTVYYEDSTLYQKFLNETESDIVLTLTDPDGNDLQIDLTRVKFNSGQPDVSGEGSVTVTMDFSALYSSGDASQIVITRTPV